MAPLSPSILWCIIRTPVRSWNSTWGSVTLFLFASNTGISCLSPSWDCPDPQCHGSLFVKHQDQRQKGLSHHTLLENYHHCLQHLDPEGHAAVLSPAACIDLCAQDKVLSLIRRNKMTQGIDSTGFTNIMGNYFKHQGRWLLSSLPNNWLIPFCTLGIFE